MPSEQDRHTSQCLLLTTVKYYQLKIELSVSWMQKWLTAVNLLGHWDIHAANRKLMLTLGAHFSLYLYRSPCHRALAYGEPMMQRSSCWSQQLNHSNDVPRCWEPFIHTTLRTILIFFFQSFFNVCIWVHICLSATSSLMHTEARRGYQIP